MQFDVHLNSDADKDDIPYFIELQSDYASLVRLRIVAPLRSGNAAGPLPKLQPTLEVDGVVLRLAISELFSIEPHALGPVVANLRSDHDRIISALDFLFTGV